MDNDIYNRLRQLDIEDFIWMIYIGIIFLSWFSNGLERKYILSKSENSKNQYRKVIQIIFSILVVVYLYFLKSSVDDIRNLKPTDSDKKRKFVYLSFLASLFIACSGFILLYIAYADEDLSVELAFN